MNDRPELDGEWYASLRQIAEERGHAPAGVGKLPDEDWTALLGFVIAHMTNLGYVPLPGWREALASYFGRP